MVVEPQWSIARFVVQLRGCPYLEVPIDCADRVILVPDTEGAKADNTDSDGNDEAIFEEYTAAVVLHEKDCADNLGFHWL